MCRLVVDTNRPSLPSRKYFWGTILSTAGLLIASNLYPDSTEAKAALLEDIRLARRYGDGAFGVVTRCPVPMSVPGTYDVELIKMGQPSQVRAQIRHGAIFLFSVQDEPVLLYLGKSLDDQRFAAMAERTRRKYGRVVNLYMEGEVTPREGRVLFASDS